ncbi:ATP-binding protein [Sediminibacterium ginsengisoli]|uniref:histidine kinase n=1 Tax=Sediminibacterium ginsengisoli TaxID=413434 RepID=A0A1T4R1C8_9BACT|nr:tetratricopeptide repeat-containing sensor histidine kinase [Sediminibacterium ginsengisoli]SKA09813.1 Signal transduction histidine kinase [Sediminibacterium ginsengisoli]
MHAKVKKAIPARILSIFIAVSSCLTACAQQPPPVTQTDTIKEHVEKLTDTAHQLLAGGDRGKALQYHKQALQHSKKARLPEHEARSLVHIARILKTEDAGKSLEHLNAAMNIAKEINHKQLQSDIYLAMAEVYRQQENYTEALHALEEHHRLLDSLFTLNKKHEIARIQAEDKRQMERWLLLAGLSTVAIVAIVLAVYFRKIKKLNTALQQSNLVKDKLFSILAHDLRGPAANIAQSLELIEAGVLPAGEQQQLLEQLGKQSTAFANTLQALLDWANSQLRGITNTPVLFDAREVVENNIQVLSGQLTEKQLYVEDKLPATVPLFADRHHFDIIIRNLLSNAVKFSHPGGTIHVDMTEENDVYVFAVRDEGIGISPERQKQLNTAGIDVSFGTKGEKGTGLGLMLSKEFAKALGGNIWLTSEEGRGTTFYFSVRRKKQ